MRTLQGPVESVEQGFKKNSGGGGGGGEIFLTRFPLPSWAWQSLSVLYSVSINRWIIIFIRESSEWSIINASLFTCAWGTVDY